MCLVLVSCGQHPSQDRFPITYVLPQYRSRPARLAKARESQGTLRLGAGMWGRRVAGVWGPHSCGGQGQLCTSRGSAHAACVPSAQGAVRPWAPAAGRALPPRQPAGFPAASNETGPNLCFYLKAHAHTRATYLHGPVHRGQGWDAGCGMERGGSHITVHTEPSQPS